MVFIDDQVENVFRNVNVLAAKEGIPPLPRGVFLRFLRGTLESMARLPKYIESFSKYIDDNFGNVSFLYFTTFRRVSDDLESLRRFGFLGSEDDLQRIIPEFNDNIEISNYAMGDVQSKIEAILSAIRRNALESYDDLNENLLNQYLSLNSTSLPSVHLDEKRLRIVLSRLGDRISQDTVESIFESLGRDADNQNDILNNYLFQLMVSYDKTKSYELQINNFREVVNKFLIRKHFEYNSGTLEFKIIDDFSGRELPLVSLSSGEKQIVSIFSSLYLTEDNNVFMFIDEPELSLSIEWQKLMVDEILKADSLKYMIAVTHSPFIIDSDIAFSHALKLGYKTSDGEE